MGKYTITGTLSAAEKATIHNSTVLVGTNYHFEAVDVTPEIQKHLHKVGPSRSAFDESMRTARTTYDTELSGAMDLTAYDDNRTLFLENQIILNELKVVFDKIEKINEVAINNDHDIALKIYSEFQNLGKTNKGIHDFITNEALTHFHKSEHKLPGLSTISAGLVVTVNHCVIGKKAVNAGDTVLTFNHKGASVTTLKKVLPGDSFEIPSTWVDIEVTNLSTTADGEFSIPTKP